MFNQRNIQIDMKKLLILSLIGLFTISCSSSDTNTQESDPPASLMDRNIEPSTPKFTIVGKWIIYEDVDKRRLSKEKATIIFKENGDATWIENTKNRSILKYEFSQEFKTLSVGGEILDVEILDNNNVLVTGSSGNEFVSQMVRQ